MIKEELLVKIQKQRDEIEATKESMEGTRGLLQDVLRGILPIMEEQLDIMEGTIKAIPTRADSAGYLLVPND